MPQENEFALPKSIQEQVEMAEQAHAKIFNKEEETPPEDSTVIEEPEEQEPEPQQEPDEEETYKARYKTLQGMQSKLAQELRELKAQLVEKQEPVVETPQVKENPRSERISKLLTEYGDDLVEDWKALIEDRIEQVINPVLEQTQTIKKTQDEIRQEEFSKELTRRSANWEDKWDSVIQASRGEQPVDPKFIEFLDTPDPNGFYTYGEILAKANTEWDVDKLAKVFNIYEQTKAPVKQERTQRPVSTERESIVAPSRVQSIATPDANDAQIWSMEDINRFKTEDRLGKFKPEVSAALWDDLLRATAEGRVRP